MEEPIETIALVSADGLVFQVDIRVARMSGTIKDLIGDADIYAADFQGIPLANMTGKVLWKILSYLQFHFENPAMAEQKTDPNSQISDWDVEFFKVDQTLLFNIILAANYLDTASLLDMACKTIANTLKGKTPEEIRKIYGIRSDLSVEQDQKIRADNAWAIRG